MTMNRRMFLAALIGGATIGSALVSSGADAATVNEYRKLIDYQEKIILLSKDIKNWKMQLQEVSDMNVIIDEMLAHLMFDFVPVTVYSKANYYSVQALFKNELDTLQEENLRSIEKSVVPIAIMKFLLAKHRVPMFLNNTDRYPAPYAYATHFGEFSKRYNCFLDDVNGPEKSPHIWKL